MFRDGGGLSADGFFLPRRSGGDTVPIHITNVGGRSLDPKRYDAFVAAVDGGFGRSIWLAANAAAEALKDDERVSRPDDPPPLSLVWTGGVPGYPHAATVLQGDTYAGPRSAALGYGETPGPEARSEDKDEGSVSLGTGGGDRRARTPETFVAGAYTQLKDVPYLVLAGSGATETLHAFVGDQDVSPQGADGGDRRAALRVRRQHRHGRLRPDGGRPGRGPARVALPCPSRARAEARRVTAHNGEVAGSSPARRFSTACSSNGRALIPVGTP